MPVPAHLTDTNIPSVSYNVKTRPYDLIRAALRSLRAAGATLFFTSQKLAEFWSVCTRPVTRNGYGLSIPEADRRAGLIESSFTFLPHNALVHDEWRRLVVVHSVVGVNVYDMMQGLSRPCGSTELLICSLSTKGISSAIRD